MSLGKGDESHGKVLSGCFSDRRSRCVSDHDPFCDFGEFLHVGVLELKQKGSKSSSVLNWSSVHKTGSVQMWDPLPSFRVTFVESKVEEVEGESGEVRFRYRSQMRRGVSRRHVILR